MPVPFGEGLFVEHRMESGLVAHGLPIQRILPDGYASVWWSALYWHKGQDLDRARAKTDIGFWRVRHAHDDAFFVFVHIEVSPSRDQAAGSSADELKQPSLSCLRLVEGASPQRLLRKDTGDLARVPRRGHREGVLALAETERLALPTSSFEVAAKRAIERGGVEAGDAPHQAGRASA